MNLKVTEDSLKVRQFERLVEHVIQEHAPRAEIDAVTGRVNDGRGKKLRLVPM
jgi:hypothetical protein